MIGIDGKYMSEIAVGGVILPFSHGNSRFHIVENVRQLLPTFVLEFNDPYGTLTGNNALGDGVPVLVKMGIYKADLNKNYSQFYIVGAPKTIQGPNGVVTKVTCHLSVPNYINTIPKKPFIGNSSDVMAQIASDCQFLKTDIDATNDSQTWLSQNKRYGVFAEKVAEHGYIDSNSCMVLGVGADATLHYKNISALTTANPVIELFYGAPSGQLTVPSYPFYDHKFISYAAVMNSNKGYNAAAVNWTVDGTNNRVDQINVKKISQYIEMSDDVKNYVGTGYSKMLPFDCGNTSASYLNAQHQNERNLAQWSEIVHVVCNCTVPVNLFDVVQFTLNDNNNYNAARSGKYIVAAKTQYIDQLYITKLVLVSQGRNTDTSTPQV